MKALSRRGGLPRLYAVVDQVAVRVWARKGLIRTARATLQTLVIQSYHITYTSNLSFCVTHVPLLRHSSGPNSKGTFFGLKIDTAISYLYSVPTP